MKLNNVLGWIGVITLLFVPIGTILMIIGLGIESKPLAGSGFAMVAPFYIFDYISDEVENYKRAKVKVKCR